MAAAAASGADDLDIAMGTLMAYGGKYLREIALSAWEYGTQTQIGKDTKKRSCHEQEFSQFCQKVVKQSLFFSAWNTVAVHLTLLDPGFFEVLSHPGGGSCEPPPGISAVGP